MLFGSTISFQYTWNRMNTIKMKLFLFSLIFVLLVAGKSFVAPLLLMRLKSTSLEWWQLFRNMHYARVLRISIFSESIFGQSTTMKKFHLITNTRVNQYANIWAQRTFPIKLIMSDNYFRQPGTKPYTIVIRMDGDLRPLHQNKTMTKLWNKLQKPVQLRT